VQEHKEILVEPLLDRTALLDGGGFLMQQTFNMAKELPYFKFEPNQWENGNIQICSREDKGLFMDLCSMYWSRLGDVPFKLAINKLCAGNATAFDSLIRENIFTVIDGAIYIDYLSEQLSEFDNTSKKNSENAKLRWEKLRKLKEESERNATALTSQCESDAIREEKRREDEIKEIIIERSIELESDFEIFWNIYDKKIDTKKCKAKFLKLSEANRNLALNMVKSYVDSTPNKEFRKNPYTWLNGECWKDEFNRTSKDMPKVQPFGGSTGFYEDFM
jgi:hypothetical protein